MKKLGITLRDLSYADLIDCAHFADNVGIDSLWIPESIGQRDASVLLAVLATLTQRCKLATGVLNVYLRTPMQTVMMASTIDEVSRGRFILGLGAGNQSQLQLVGLSLDRPILYIREFTEFFRLGLSLPEVSYKGKLFTIPAFTQKSRQQDVKVPVYIAAHNPQMLKLAGSIADGVLLNMISTTDLPKSIAIIREGEKKALRKNSVDIAAYILTCISNDKLEAVQAAKLVLASFCNSPIFRKRLRNMESPFAETANAVHQTYGKNGMEAAISLIDDDVVHDYSIAGDFAHLQRRIQDFENAGLDTPILSIFPVPLKLKQFFPPLAESGLREAVLEILSHVELSGSKPDKAPQ